MATPATTGVLKTKVSDMQIGDYIIARYWSGASAGQFGGVDSLGTTTATEIPVAGLGANAAGSFYFVKAGKGLLIADRIVHNSISWDTLNTAKTIQGLPWGASNIIPNMTSYTTPSPYVVTSNNDGNGVAWHAFDVDSDPTGLNTSWVANVTRPSGGHWIKIDLGSPSELGILRLTTTEMGTGTVGLKNWELWGSLDDINYIKLATGTQANNTSEQEYKVSNYNKYRYYRINCLDSYSTAQPEWNDISTIKMLTYDGIIRSLTGGVAYADANGNSATADASKGAWPQNNEYDKYIVNFDPAKIQAGKTLDDVFHWSNLYSWTQNTPVVGLAANTMRIVRGKVSIDRWAWSASTSSTVDFGYRPIFEYKE